jgi:hypothetical protein
MPPTSPAGTTEILASENSTQDLTDHRGHWVAYRADDGRLIAGCPTLKELEARIRAAGDNAEEVLFDRIPAGVAISAGSELS